MSNKTLSSPSANISRIPVRAKTQEHEYEPPRPISSPILSVPNSPRDKLKKLIPVKYKCNLERPTHDFYELPHDISDLPLDVKLDKPVAFFDPTDISFVDEPISKDDLDAALVGLIPPFSKPTTPRAGCIQHSCSVFQKKPIQGDGKGKGTRSRKRKNPPTPSKIPVRKKINPPNPLAIIKSMSRHSLLDDIRIPSDMNQSDDLSAMSSLSVVSVPTEEVLQSTLKPPSHSSDAGGSIGSDLNEGSEMDSVFAYFPESEDEIHKTSQVVEAPREAPETEIILSLPLPATNSSKCVSDICKKPGENGDGPHMLKKKSSVELGKDKNEVLNVDVKVQSDPAKKTIKEDVKIQIGSEKNILKLEANVANNQKKQIFKKGAATQNYVKKILKKGAKTQYNAKQEFVKKEADIPNESDKEATIQTEFSTEAVKHRVSFSQGIESKELLDACKIILPKPSTLIMRRMDEAELTPVPSPLNLSDYKSFPLESSSSCSFGERRFAAKFAIHNTSTELYGFKIYCNYTAMTNLTITPSQGLLRPLDRISIRIRTKKSKKYTITNDRLMDAKFAVKYFMSTCKDPRKLGEYFNLLCNQRPELIKSEMIEKVILLDSGDLLSTTRLLDTFRKLSDEQEDEGIFQNEDDETDELLNILMNESQRNTLKKSLFQEYASQVLPQVRDRSKLHSLQMEMFVTNQTLRKYVGRLGKIEGVIHAVMYFTICFLAFSYVVPFLNTTLVVEEAKKKEVVQDMYRDRDKSYNELPFHGKILNVMERWIGINIFS